MTTARSNSALRVTTAAALTLTLATTSWAHYLWVTIDAKTGEHGTTNIYFEGGAGPGDGRYNDPFVERGKTWIETLDTEKPTEIKMADTKKPGKRWLSAQIPSSGPRSISSYGKWGVYRYGKTDVLLHYYSKLIDTKDGNAFYKLGRSEPLGLDVVPVKVDEGRAFQVLWKGKPIANRTVQIRGPKGFKATPKTNKDGRVTFSSEAQGRLTVKTTVEEKEEGEFEGKTYQLIRHNFTMLITFPE